LKISRKLVISSIGILLIAATLVPALFLDVPSDDRVIELLINYKHHEAVYTSISGWRSSDEIMNYTYKVSAINMTEVLSVAEANGYTLWANVSSWHIGSQVTIGAHAINITSEIRVLGYDCWRDEDSSTLVSYCKDLGLLISSSYFQFSSSGGGELWGVDEQYTLSFSNLDALNQTYVRLDGLLISGIMVEIAIIIAIMAASKKKGNTQSE
jgi:hypothetical protein